MNPQEAAIQQPQPMPAQAPAQPQPIYQTEAWFIPKGKRTIFSYVKVMASVYPGWLIITDAATHAELHRIALGPELKTMRFLSMFYVRRSAGVKFSWFDAQSGVMVSPKQAYLLLFAGLALRFLGQLVYLGYEVNLFVVLMGSVFVAVSILWMALTMKPAGQLKKACKQAAGVA